MEDILGMDTFLCTARLKGFDQDCIAVMFKEDCAVFAAAAGSNGEATSLARWKSSCELDSFEEDIVTSDFGFNCVRGQGSCGAHGSFCGTYIFPVLSHVPFGGGKRLGELLADKRRRESRPCGEVACINGLGLGGGDGDESGAVQELHKIRLRRHFVGTVILNMR